MSSRIRPSRFSLRQNVVRPAPGASRTRSSAISPARARTTSAWWRRRSGATTCMPREPEVIAKGVRPSARSRSPSSSAPARIVGKWASGSSSGGSRSKTIRSGKPGRSARLGHACGVMQFWLASQTSVATSPPTAWVTSPPLRRSTVTVRTHAGAPFGIACWITTGLSIPAFQRQRLSGRSLTCGAITGCDVGVVVGEVGLRDPVGGEQELVGAADPHGPPPGSGSRSRVPPSPHQFARMAPRSLVV